MNAKQENSTQRAASGITRRDMFKAGGILAVAGAGLAALSGCSHGTRTAEAEAEENLPSRSWAKKPDPITDIADTVECDLVVVGAGNGGMVGAMTAQEKGFKVIVLEKGNDIAEAREAIGSIGSRHSKGHVPNKAKLMNHAKKTQLGDVNMALYKTWMDKSGEFMDWLEDLEKPEGMTFPFEYHAPKDPDAYYPAMCTNPIKGKFHPNGPNYGAYMHLQVLKKLFLKAGGQIEFLTPAQQLVQDESGKVTGVIAQSQETKRYTQYNAKRGVILCTGGYGANREMVQDLCPNMWNYATANSATGETGDGIRMALWAGGVLEEGGAAMVWNRGVVKDDEKLGADLGNPLFLPASQPFLRVNVHGERIMNEDSTYPEIFAMGQRQPKGFTWQVFDATYWDDIKRFDTCGCSRLHTAPNGSAFNADVYSLEALDRKNLDNFWMKPALEGGYLKKCGTLEELAHEMKFDKEETKTFLATVKRYNKMMKEGDTDYGKPAYRCSTVDTAPYYAVRTAGNFLVSLQGVITDTKSRCLRADGSVIEGLYVCGNDQGGFYPHGYPSNFTGINAGRCATFARIAAKDACGIA